jgi:hypothetical protein
MLHHMRLSLNDQSLVPPHNRLIVGVPLLTLNFNSFYLPHLHLPFPSHTKQNFCYTPRRKAFFHRYILTRSTTHIYQSIDKPWSPSSNMPFFKGVSFIKKVSAAHVFGRFCSSLPPEATVRCPQLEHFLVYPFRFVQHGIFTNISRLSGEPPIAFTPCI